MCNINVLIEEGPSPLKYQNIKILDVLLIIYELSNKIHIAHLLMLFIIYIFSSTR